MRIIFYSLHTWGSSLSLHQLGLGHLCRWESRWCLNLLCDSWWMVVLITAHLFGNGIALNLEMPDCWPMLSKFAWFQKGNPSFCSFRQHPSSTINQSSDCLGTLAVTHTDGSFSVTIVLTRDRQRKALCEKAMTGNACPWQHGFGGSSGFLQSKAVSLSCWDPELTFFTEAYIRKLVF